LKLLINPLRNFADMPLKFRRGRGDKEPWEFFLEDTFWD
jgi:hypothetical protein